MSDAAVITAIYDGYDDLKPAVHQVGLDVEWILVTDDPTVPEDVLGWHVICEPRPGIHPNRAAKRPKFLPWEYTDAPASVWVDGSYRVTSPALAAEVLATADPLTQFIHPYRGCAYAEAEYSLTLEKYSGEPLAAQAACYREAGFPEQWGLWTTPLIGRQHTAEVRQFGELWLAEVDRWSFQDQVSEPYVLHSLGLRPALLPGDHWFNPWVKWEGSARH
jgi:hypothetical protein